MAKRQFQLTDDEIVALQAAERDTRDVHHWRRLQAVRLYGAGMAQAQFQTVVGCSERRARQWAGQYRATGLDGLRSQWRGGNANKLTAARRAELTTRLHQSAPHELLPVDAKTSRGQFWSVATLREALRQWYGLTWADDDSYRQLMRRYGFSPNVRRPNVAPAPVPKLVAAFEAEVKKPS